MVKIKLGKIFYPIIFIFLVVLIFVGIYNIFHDNYKRNTQKIGDVFCASVDHKRMTDHSSFISDTVYVECDYNFKYKTEEVCPLKCIKHDKWGQCITSDYDCQLNFIGVI